MNNAVSQFRRMLKTGTVTQKGDKFIRQTSRADWAETFRELVASLGGSSITANNTIIATLPADVAEAITATKEFSYARPNNARPSVPGYKKRQTWGSTFDPDTLLMMQMLSKKLGKAPNRIVEQAIEEMAERENVFNDI